MSLPSLAVLFHGALFSKMLRESDSGLPGNSLGFFPLFFFEIKLTASMGVEVSGRLAHLKEGLLHLAGRKTMLTLAKNYQQRDSVAVANVGIFWSRCPRRGAESAGVADSRFPAIRSKFHV